MATLLDAYGRPVKTQALRRELAAPTLSGIRTLWTETVASGLTPQRLARVLQAAAEGDPDAYLTLAEEIEERDAHYASVLGTRKRAVSGIKPIVEPASERRLDKRIAAAVTTMPGRPGIKRGIASLLDALGKGYAVAEILWQTDPSWEPVELTWRDPRFFVFDQVSRSEIRLRHETDPALGIPLAPFKFVQHVPALKIGIPIRGGLARLVAWCYLFKAYSIKDWMAFLDVFGMPLRLGRYDPSAKPDDIEILKAAVANLGSDAAAVMPKGMEIEFQALSGLSGTESLFERAADWFDAQISKAVLGQTMTADNGSSLAQAKVHNEVRHDIQTADADELEITIERDLIRPYVDLNFGPQQAYPRISYPVKQPENLKALSRSVAMLVPVGLKVKASELREKLGLSEPQDGDELLEAQAPKPPAAVADTGVNHHQGCPDCGVALNNAGSQDESEIESQPQEHEMDEIERPFLDDWEPQIAPLLAPLRELVDGAGSYDDLRAGLAELLAAFDDADQELIDGLGHSGFVAYALGNGQEAD